MFINWAGNYMTFLESFCLNISSKNVLHFIRNSQQQLQNIIHKSCFFFLFAIPHFLLNFFSLPS